MAESPEKEELLTRLLHSHRMDISTISHEIRNPLTLIYSTLQMIEASNPEVLNIRHWSDLHSDIEYMKQLLEELSAYNNGQRLSPSSTDFDIFLKKISLSFASSIIETDIEFISRIEPGTPCYACRFHQTSGSSSESSWKCARCSTDSTIYML